MAETTVKPPPQDWRCGHCNKTFVREANFLKHSCKDMEKDAVMKTVVGHNAYRYYAYWMATKKRKVPSAAVFRDSLMFSAFVRFAEHANKLHIPSPERYIDLMVRSNYDPPMWTRNDGYKLYLDWIDRCSDPFEQAGATVDMLYRLAEAAGVPLNGVFNAIHPREFIELIRLRKLSPWLLFASAAFKQFVMNMDRVDREELLETVGHDFWAQRFQENPAVVSKMLVIAKEMGI